MATCKQSPQEFIKNAFTPQIAVMCTPLAAKCCQKNNLNFIELLQPFSKLSNDVHFWDPSGTLINIRNLKLTFLDVNFTPPHIKYATKFLNNSVSKAIEPRTQCLYVGDHKLEIPLSTPWFENWRETFLKVQYPSDHEYTKHFLSCVIVISSAEIDPLASAVQLAQSLNQMQNNTPGKLPKWFNSNILKYYVIVHDNSEGRKEAGSEAYEAIKNAYGENNCFLLRMNSRPLGSATTEHLPDPWSQFINSDIESNYFKATPESSPHPIRATDIEVPKTNLNYHPLSPDTEELNINGTPIEPVVTPNPIAKAHGLCLTTEDVEQIKLFIYEYCKTCLLPYIEKQIIQLNDVISNKKGVSRSLFSATKRWFNPNKPGASSVAVNNLIYSPDSPELQVRRLGDLYFMFGHYSAAFQAYYLAKRDYNADQAWLYYAGALEMASLSAFMCGEANRKTCDYMEECITTYLNTCKMPQFATRATLLGSECLKSRSMYGEAALQLIRMTSEESDLRSALFLEQASYCFLNSKMSRKYAFHMVLAGHRFSKAAQRKHSLRSYKQAFQIYEDSGWALAEDHIHYTIGRQAHNLHLFDEAVNSFARLLKRDSKQSSQQQEIFLKEYLTILGNKLQCENSEELPILALPELDIKSIKILMGPTAPLTTPGLVPATGISFDDNDNLNSKWIKLEELLVQEAQDFLPPIFKPMVTLYTYNDLNKMKPIAIVNEPIRVCISVINLLQIPLNLKDIHLLWIYNGKINNDENYIKTHITKNLIIQNNSNQNLILQLTPLKIGDIKIIGICYILKCQDNIFINGKQLFELNNIKIVPSAPCLQVSFSELNLECLCDEIQKVTIEFRNTGAVPLNKILMATSVPNLLCNYEYKNSKLLLPLDNNNQNINKDKYIKNNYLTSVPLPNNKLEPEQSITITIYLKAPNKPGNCIIDLLIYYENIDNQIIPKYRLVRHKWLLSVQESIKVELNTQRGYNCKTIEELELVMRICNLNKVHSTTFTQLNLHNVGLLSRYWILTKDIVIPKFITLHSEESIHILLKARRINENINKYSFVLLNSELAIKQCFNNAFIAFAKKTEQCSINIFNDINENGILFVQWQALVTDNINKRTVYGQTQVQIKINDNDDDNGNNDNEEKDKNDEIIVKNDEKPKNKLTYNLLYPAVVEHNFEQEKLCVVPVTLLIHSIVKDQINIIIKTIGAGSTTPYSNLFYPYASRNFTWLGIGKAIRNLQPLSTIPIQLSVVVTNPGTFDLGSKLEILCEDIPQVSPLQSALIVVGNS